MAEQGKNQGKTQAPIKPRPIAKPVTKPMPVTKPAIARKPEGADDNYKHLVRIANTDLDGAKTIGIALTKIQGVGKMFSNAVCHISGVDIMKRAGMLSDAEIKKLDDVVTKPTGYDIPGWMFNRKRDPETGEDVHIITGDLKFFTENDVKLMKKIKCYKGVRHSQGLPVRGQRTKSNFRKNKGKGKGSLGVQRKKILAAKT